MASKHGEVMKLSEIRKELSGWAALFGKEYDPEVKVRIGRSTAALSCMEVGDSDKNEGITIGDWSNPWEDQDQYVDEIGNVIVDPSMS